MLLTEYNEKFHIDNEKEISFEEGKELGRQEEIVSLEKDGLLKLDVAAQRLNMTVEEFEKLMNSINMEK